MTWVLYYLAALGLSFIAWFLYRVGPRGFVVYAIVLGLGFWFLGGGGMELVGSHVKRFMPESKPSPPPSPPPVVQRTPRPIEAVPPANPQLPRRDAAPVSEQKPTPPQLATVPPPKQFVAPTSGILPVKEIYPGANALVFGLGTIEIAEEGKILRFSFVAVNGNPESVVRLARAVDIFLDYPDETTFVVDYTGRRYQLAQATNISEKEPLRVEENGRRAFTLDFPLPKNTETFGFSVGVMWRESTQVPPQTHRIQMGSKKQILFRDFR